MITAPENGMFNVAALNNAQQGRVLACLCCALFIVMELSVMPLLYASAHSPDACC